MRYSLAHLPTGFLLLWQYLWCTVVHTKHALKCMYAALRYKPYIPASRAVNFSLPHEMGRVRDAQSCNLMLNTLPDLHCFNLNLY